MRKKKSHVGIIIGLIILTLSIGLVVYPYIAQAWNANRESYAVQNYNDTASNLNDEQIAAMLKAAEDYNAKLAHMQVPLQNKDAEDGYYDLLNTDGNDGVIGTLNVPSINVELPIYHGTSKEVLLKGAGHMIGSSLPVGGPSTHAVISAHCGMPEAELFTYLDQIKKGDMFTITVLNRTLTYQVDQIKTVDPDDDDDIQIVDGQDYVTLLTCTPYGVNTHRLLVRGHRVPNVDTPQEMTVSRPKKSFLESLTIQQKIIGFTGIVTAITVLIIKIAQHNQKGDD